jgi:hypothetical protein
MFHINKVFLKAYNKVNKFKELCFSFSRQSILQGGKAALMLYAKMWRILILWNKVSSIFSVEIAKQSFSHLKITNKIAYIQGNFFPFMHFHLETSYSNPSDCLDVNSVVTFL